MCDDGGSDLRLHDDDCLGGSLKITFNHEKALPFVPYLAKGRMLAAAAIANCYQITIDLIPYLAEQDWNKKAPELYFDHNESWLPKILEGVQRPFTELMNHKYVYGR